MSDLALAPEQIEERRRERAYQLGLLEIPAMRVIGSALLSLGVFLHNRYILGDLSLDAWAGTTLMLGVYCAVSWILTILSFKVWRRNPTAFFLAFDLVIWTIVIYQSGAENSLLFFILTLRVADQTQTTFRRCLAFALLATLCYAAMLGWIVVVDGRPVSTSVIAVKTTFIVLSGLYIAMSSRTAERRRAQMAEAIRMSRTLIRRMEEQSGELMDARSKAEEGSAAKSEFVANMSHEMRTPLHGVIGMLQLAIDEELSPRRVRQLEMARRSAESLLGTIDDILDFAKIEARKIELEPVYFSIRDMLTETLKALGVTAAAKGLVLAAGVAQEVPDTVWGDPLRLKQILVNLVGNAIKFTERGEIAVRVSMAGQRMRFEVRDTGIGIPEDQREKIFSPFAQADGSTSRRFGGTGLGLAIVTRLIEAMGGHLELASEPGKGSSFSFVIHLPFDEVGARPRMQEWERSLAGKSVLLIEPNETSRQLVAEILRSRDFKVTESISGAEPPPGRYDCAITADQVAPMEPSIIITSPLEHVLDDHHRVVRPVMERELIDALGVALGYVRRPAVRTVPEQPRQYEALRVLVAEDNLVNQEFAAEALRKFGHRVSVASDGEEALSMMREEIYDLVLMDVQMPKLSGLDVTRRYRTDEPEAIHTPIVALTAHTAREERQRCLEAGMDAVLSKPIDIKQLQDVVRSVTGIDPIVEAMGGNLQLLERVSEAFAKQTPALLSAMHAAIENSDSDSLYRAAHTMKGAVSNFENDPSYDLSVMVEQAATDRDFTRASSLMVRLEAAVTALERRISAAVLR